MASDFDVIVIGGGHAGIEAAWAASSLGAATALVTFRSDTIGQMSCNPAIGGVGKGQIVREIDALGGLMGLAADATGMQFRMLNRSKGPAVWGPRCQSDRHAYAAWMRQVLATRSNLSIIEGEATDIVVCAGRVEGVAVMLASGRLDVLRCSSAVVTVGTFLNGLMHLGDRQFAGGRYDEPAAAHLSDALRRCGLELGRLKTGTCPRLAADSIDYGQCTRQDGDDPPTPFSFLNERLVVRQVPCWLCATTPEVHQIVRDNFHRAPMFTGQILSVGPRYCPSIETKVERFSDKESHLLFLEPEGRGTDWVYVNGLSTSLPQDVQERIVQAIPPLREARILRYGYAIEYDYAPPTQLDPSLGTKCVDGLYLAGQINGTTGYEEAAAQGLIAGANAALRLMGRPPLVLRRDQAYIGVMIDDLVTKGVTEPYRMFTSRSEHRLSLRSDNADRRLTELGRQQGLVDEGRWSRYSAAAEAIDTARAILKTTRRDGRSLWELLRQPQTSLSSLLAPGQAAQAHTQPAPLEQLAQLAREFPNAISSLAIDGRYEGYLLKEQAAMAQMQELDAQPIPGDIDYSQVSHLRHEARQKLSAIRPQCLGQALRVSGITPADITILSIHIAARLKQPK